MPEGALTQFTACDAYRSLLGGPGIVNDVTKVGHAQTDWSLTALSAQ